MGRRQQPRWVSQRNPGLGSRQSQIAPEMQGFARVNHKLGSIRLLCSRQQEDYTSEIRGRQKPGPKGRFQLPKSHFPPSGFRDGLELELASRRARGTASDGTASPTVDGAPEAEVNQPPRARRPLRPAGGVWGPRLYPISCLPMRHASRQNHGRAREPNSASDQTSTGRPAYS